MLILVEHERWQRAFVFVNDTPLDTCLVFCCNIYLSGTSKPPNHTQAQYPFLVPLQNPTIVTKFLEEFIGFSEHYDGAPVAQQPSIMHLPADTSKRDVVVSAFKV